MRNRGKKGKGPQGTCIKDPRAKLKGDKIEGGKWGWLGQEKIVVGKRNLLVGIYYFLLLLAVLTNKGDGEMSPHCLRIQAIETLQTCTIALFLVD